MNFSSDNVTGASDRILAAIVSANAGAMPAYGNDRLTQASERRLADVFEYDIEIALVATGTAANALSLAYLAPPGTAVFCHEEAHVIDDECGAPEFFTSGAKLVGIPGSDSKIRPAALQEALTRYPRGVVRQVQPSVLSLSQATEAGTVYDCGEVAALAEIAHAAGLKVHMDGARFANALVSLGVSPAAMTWKAGVDVLSFGASKNGALACEAVVSFGDGRRGADLPYRRKRGGHTLSKGRFLGAQMSAYLDADHWLDNARAANRAAARLRDGLEQVDGVRCPWPQHVNEVFAIFPRTVDTALRSEAFQYHDWSTRSLTADAEPREHEVMARFICSFATTDAEVDELLASFMRNSVRRRDKLQRLP